MSKTEKSIGFAKKLKHLDEMVTDDFTGYAFKARNLTRLSIIK